MSFSSGRVNCPPDRVEQCQAFKAEVESEGAQPIPLLVAADPESETDDGRGRDRAPTRPSPESTEEPDSTEESESTDDGGG